MENIKTLITLDRWAGINTDIKSDILPPQDESVYLIDGDNIIIKNATIKKLQGVDYLNDISTQLGEATKRNVLGIPIYRKYAGTKELLAILPTKFYHLVGDETWTVKTVTPALAGVNDSILSYANAGDKFYFVLDSQGIVYEWNGETLSATSFTADPIDVLTAKFLLYHRDDR